MQINERIRERRKELGLSADEVADRLGVSRATVYRYESSFIEKVPAVILEPLAQILSTTPAYLMGWTEQDGERMDSEKTIQKKEAPADTAEAIRIYVESKLGRPANKDELALVEAAADGLIERLKEQNK